MQLSYLERYQRRRRWMAVGFTILFAILVVIYLWWMGPGPPREITVATGPEGGAYRAFGKEYQTRLEAMGLQVKLIESQGSLENIQLLKAGKADLAFVQGGTVGDGKGIQPPAEAESLRGMAALFLEPVWVFHQQDLAFERLDQLEGRKIAIGPSGSGTEVAARQLLRASGVMPEEFEPLQLQLSESAKQLIEGKIDAAIFVASHRSPLIQELVRQENLALLDFRRAQAYTRRLSYLQTVHLGEGLFDLEANVPDRELTLVAPVVEFVCLENLHPRVAEQVLRVSQELHSPGSLIDPPGKFPTLDGVDLPVLVAARNYLQSGESLLSRLLPYRVLIWVLRLQIFLLPLLTLWIPFAKFLPSILQFRIKNLLKIHYGALREAETLIEEAKTPEELETRIEDLTQLREEMERLSRKVPGYLQREVYHWRLHIALVHDQAVRRLEEWKVKETEEN
ncbi:TAXI family TRAP transporter solute-binding subunit [Planctomycetales bacterium 10988]|nr:TAXI family TRAP transporter solute-binding subunit [Planctomycetales bacterium 10988]